MDSLLNETLNTDSVNTLKSQLCSCLINFYFTTWYDVPMDFTNLNNVNVDVDVAVNASSLQCLETIDYSCYSYDDDDDDDCRDP